MKQEVNAVDDTPETPRETPRETTPAPPPGTTRSGPKPVSLDQFFEIELRVAEVVGAERIPKADRLLKLDIDLGDERRQIVAGIAESYELDSLIGKRIIVVANLAPATIRGVESQGMLLAADLGGRPILAGFAEQVPPGTRVR